MKKVEKVSIAEISFTLDSDAYVSLKQYLDSLNDYYEKDPDGREIIADIEARVAELILDEQVYTKVVSKPLVDTIIAQLGTPDQIDDTADEGAEARFSGASAASEPTIPRRLHRSDEGKIFGGVCSGLARFLDISVAWVRFVFLLPLIIILIFTPVHWHWFQDFAKGWCWVFFVTYIVLWIALPMARTPRQKLEARGEKITPSSIRQNMQGSVNTPAGKKAASVAAELVNVLGRVVLFFVKFVMAVIGFTLMFAVMGLFIGMITVPFFSPDEFIINSHHGTDIFSMLDGMAILSPLLFTELVLLCALLPPLVIGMALLSFTFSWSLGRLFYGVTLVTWAVAMIFCGIVTLSNVHFFRDELGPRLERLDDDRDGHRHGKRLSIREIREALEDTDGLSIDADGDSLTLVVKHDDAANDTIVLYDKTGAVTVSISSTDSVANDTTGEMNVRKRIEIRRIEE